MKSPEQYQQLQELFLRLRDMTGADRTARLQEIAEDLRSELVSLLRADAQTFNFLELSEEACEQLHDDKLAGDDSSTSHFVDNRPATKLPMNLGKYKLLEVIGEGGFGTVFLASQAGAVQRKVAVKLTKPGMDSKELLARFRAEQQALAMMNHPSIASVFDAGIAEDGRPFFVMELVKGIPIDEFCERNELKLDDRLDLIMQVCKAVHHAHQKGVIHRDLKPSNILITMTEDKPLAKVIDFGIAKALDSRLTEETLFTSHGQMIGTLEYMSPEQSEMSAVDIDTRSDVYSLGAIIYCLLTGRPPLKRSQILQSGFYDIAKQIRETEPVLPSTQATANRELLTQVDRLKEPGGLQELRQDDLDWIVMKALAKDRRRRYESAIDLSRDLDRYRRGELVDAHPPSIGYRFSKFVRRNRRLVIPTIAIVLGLVFGLVGLWVGLNNAIHARRDAEENYQQMVEAQATSKSSAQKLSKTIYPELINSAWGSARQFDTEKARQMLAATELTLRDWEWEFVSSYASTTGNHFLRSKGESALIGIDISKDGKWLACATDGGDIEIRDISGELLAEIQGDYRSTVVCFAEKVKRLYVGTVEGQLLGFALGSWNQVFQKELQAGGVYDIVTSPDSDTLAICTGGSKVKLFEPESETVTESWTLPSRISQLLFLDSQHLIGSGLDGGMYQLERGKKEFNRLDISDASITSLARLSRNVLALQINNRVALVEFDREWSLANQQPDQQMWLSAIEADDSGLLYLGCGDGKLFLLSDNDSRQPVAEFGAAIRVVRYSSEIGRCLVALSDGRLLSFAGRDSTTWTQPSKDRAVSGFAFAEQGRRVALIHDETTLSQYRINPKKGGLDAEWISANSSMPKSIDKGIWSMSVSDSGSRLALLDEERMLRIIDLESDATLWEKRIGWGVRDVCLAPDGSWVATAPPESQKNRSGTIGIWNVQTGDCQKILKGHDNWVVTLRVTPDGSKLISGDVNRACRVWEVESGQCLHVLRPEKMSVANQFALSNNGQVLYIGHRDGWVSKWDLEKGTKTSSWLAFGDSITGLKMVSEQRLLVAARSSSNLKVFDVNDMETASVDLGLGYIQSLKVSPNNESLGVLNNRGQLLLSRPFLITEKNSH